MAIDVIAALIAILGFWYGKDKGIISMIIGVLSIFFGLVLSFKMAPTMARILESVLNSNSPLILPIAFIVNLIFIFSLFRLAARGGEGTLSALRLGFVNRALGGLLSALFALFLYGSVLWFLKETRIIGPETEEKSTTLPYLVEMPAHARELFHRIKPFFLEAWDVSSKWMERAKEYGEEKTRNLGAEAPADDQPRLYKIEEGDKGRIEKKPYDSRPKNRELYEDTGIEY